MFYQKTFESTLFIYMNTQFSQVDKADTENYYKPHLALLLVFEKGLFGHYKNKFWNCWAQSNKQIDNLKYNLPFEKTRETIYEL